MNKVTRINPYQWGENWLGCYRKLAFDTNENVFLETFVARKIRLYARFYATSPHPSKAIIRALFKRYSKQDVYSQASELGRK